MRSVDDVMELTTQTFVRLLRRRITANIPTTEDSVRYTFFVALLHNGITPEQVVLEMTYQSKHLSWRNEGAMA